MLLTTTTTLMDTDRRIEVLNWTMIVAGAIDRHALLAAEAGRFDEAKNLHTLETGVQQMALSITAPCY